MPTRILRDGIIDSKAVNALSESAEILYRRLMSIVDDYGRFEADPELIRARCFPRQLDRWSVERVESELQACSVDNGHSPLVTVYFCGEQKYLEISNFGQRKQAKPKFPGPDSPESTVIHRDSPPRATRAHSESKSESYAETKAKTPTPSPTPKAGAVVSVDDDLTRWFTQEFWPVYPRKEAKVAALKAARAHLKTAELRAAALRGLTLQLPELTSRPPDKRPHPATWINGRRWEDEAPLPFVSIPTRNPPRGGTGVERKLGFVESVEAEFQRRYEAGRL